MSGLETSLIAIALMLFAALRRRFLLALLVVLVPVALAQWTLATAEAAPGELSGWIGILQLGPISLFLLSVLALLPRYTPADS